MGRERDMDHLDLNSTFWGNPSDKVWKKAFELALKMGCLGDDGALTEHILDGLIELSHAERGFLIVREGDDAKVVAARHVNKEDIHNSVNQLSWSVASQVFLTGKPLVIMNAQTDANFSVADSVNKLKLKSICCLPLKTEKGETLGAIVDPKN